MIRQKSRWDAVLITFICLMALIMVIPFWQIIVITFSKPRDYLLHPTHLWIYHWDASVMLGILKTPSIHRGLLVSLFVVIVGWLVSMLLTVAGGYALSHKRLPGRSLLLTLLVISMYFTGFL